MKWYSTISLGQQFRKHINSFIFYFIYGNNLKEVVSNYTALTGRYPLPQRWSLGSHQSRWGYACKEHIDEVVNG